MGRGGGLYNGLKADQVEHVQGSGLGSCTEGRGWVDGSGPA